MGEGEEDAFREYMGMQRKLRRQGLICEGVGIQDDPTELPATQWLLIPPGQFPTWPTPHLACSPPGLLPPGLLPPGPLPPGILTGVLGLQEGP